MSDNSRSFRQFLRKKFFEGWDVSLTSDHSILVLIRIRIPIRDFLAEVLPLRDRTNCKNFAKLAALAEAGCVLVPVVNYYGDEIKYAL